MKHHFTKWLNNILGQTIYSFIYEKALFLINIQKFKSNKRLINARIAFYSSFINEKSLVFDVGANEGNRIQPFLALKAKVIAVEPQKECCKLLKLKYGDRVTIIQKGLGAKVETKQLFKTKHSVLATFSNDWITKVAPTRFEASYDKVESVDMTTLDELIKLYGTPAFIKIDVEGFELEVLKGLSSGIRMISIEYTLPELRENLIQCLTHLYEMDNSILINYSVGESMLWAMKNWVNYQSFLSLLNDNNFEGQGFGDLYIKMAYS